MKNSSLKYILISDFNMFGYINGIPLFFKNTLDRLNFIPLTKNNLEDLRPDDIVVFLYPDWLDINNLNFTNDIKNYGAKIICIILDMMSFYSTYNISRSVEISFFNTFDFIITQSDKMTDFLRDHNVVQPMVNLEIFDYPLPMSRELILTKLEVVKNKVLHLEKVDPVLVYAGKFDIRFRPWIFSPVLANVKLNVYSDTPVAAREIDFSRRENVVFKGNFSMENIFENIDGNFSIIWNGLEDGVTIPIYGASMSLFKTLSISSKIDFSIVRLLPIICRKGTADANLVEKLEIGISLNHLDELENVLQKLPVSTYKKYVENLFKIALNSSKGFYLEDALHKCENFLSSDFIEKDD